MAKLREILVVLVGLVLLGSVRAQTPPGPAHLSAGVPSTAPEEFWAPACELEGGSPGCPPVARVWASGEYLLWWIKGSSAPPLVTASPVGTARASAGVLPGAAVLVGGSELEDSQRHGGRFAAGAWLDRAGSLGVEGSFFFLGERATTIDTGTSPGTPILARPVFNPVTGMEEAQLVAFPGVLAGGVNVQSTSRLLGAEGNVLCNLSCGCRRRIDLLGGYRFLRLEESLRVTETLTVLDAPFTGTGLVVADRFGTRNDFHGGQLGARATLTYGAWEVALTGKLALGVSRQEVDVSGQTTFLTAAGTVTQPGGLLALPTNMGRYCEDRFAVVPEGAVQVGYRFTEHLQAFVGYNFLYLSDVARPGDQIDRVVNRSQIPDATGPRPLVGPARPAFPFAQSDFWAQGVSVGLVWRY